MSERLEGARNRNGRVEPVRLHSESEGFGAAPRKKVDTRRRHRARRILQEPELLFQTWLASSKVWLQLRKEN